MPTHDNLPKAEGIEENKTDILEANSESTNIETQDSDVTTLDPTSDHHESPESENIQSSTIENNLQESVLEESSIDNKTEVDNQIKETDMEDVLANTETVVEKEDHVQNQMDDAVAKDSEDESTLERHNIEKKDYHAMSKEDLIKELRILIKNEKIQAIKEHAEEIKIEFNEKFNEEVEQKKEEFLADGGDIIDFYYSTPIKKEFNSIYFDYKEKRNAYYQNLKKDHQENLKRRLELIDELKGLLNADENINTTYNHFKSIQERWRNAGAIPRDKYNTTITIPKIFMIFYTLIESLETLILSTISNKN